MADRTPSKMAAARAASVANEKARQKTPDQISRDLAKGPIARPTRKHPDCPACPKSSFSNLRWDDHRGLWVHNWESLGCGGTFTADEIAGMTA